MKPNSKEQVEQSNKIALRDRQQHLADLREILSTRYGRRYIWDLMAQCKPFVNAMTGNSQTFFNLGLQFIGQAMFLDIMEATPDSFTIMQREATMDLMGDDNSIPLDEE